MRKGVRVKAGVFFHCISRHPFKGNPQNSFVSKGFWILRFIIAQISDYLLNPCQKIIPWPIYPLKFYNTNLRSQMQFKPYLYPLEWWQVSILMTQGFTHILFRFWIPFFNDYRQISLWMQVVQIHFKRLVPVAGNLVYASFCSCSCCNSRLYL